MQELPIEIQLSTIPNEPGVYQFFDSEDQILYVGKAKNLKKRVSSYFNKNYDTGKTRVLVKKIQTIKHIVVPTESDALLLENNLIKKHKPRYNVLLKDDKSYPWICIKNERFPRVFATRNLINDGSEYYGPYTRMTTVKTLLDLFVLGILFPKSLFVKKDQDTNSRTDRCIGNIEHRFKEPEVIAPYNRHPLRPVRVN